MYQKKVSKNIKIRTKKTKTKKDWAFYHNLKYFLILKNMVKYQNQKVEIKNVRNITTDNN